MASFETLLTSFDIQIIRLLRSTTYYYTDSQHFIQIHYNDKWYTDSQAIIIQIYNKSYDCSDPQYITWRTKVQGNDADRQRSKTKIALHELEIQQRNLIALVCLFGAHWGLAIHLRKVVSCNPELPFSVLLTSIFDFF